MTGRVTSRFTFDAAAPYLRRVRAGGFDFAGRLVGGFGNPPRCSGVRNVNALMGEAVGQLYVARHFPPEAKARMEALVVNSSRPTVRPSRSFPMTAETRRAGRSERSSPTRSATPTASATIPS
jgi:predicted metalloendopeptidase